MIITLAVVYNFIREYKHNLSSPPYLKVEFGDQIVLHWDPVFYRFIEDESFSAIFENLHNIPVMLSFITNEEVVDNVVCGKKRDLKKGDIAYLFLVRRLPSIDKFNCLGIRDGHIELDIDFIDESNIDKIELNCERFNVLLDYIERDRALFSKRIINCINIMFRGGILFVREHNAIFDTLIQDTIFKKNRQDIIKVEFEDQFALYWDGINHKIIKDENYFAILKNRDDMRSMARFITNEEVVYDFVCNKKSALKKGDVAYLFLNGWTFFLDMDPPLSCNIGIQRNHFEPFCRYPNHVLNYIEKNRELVSLKVMSCLESSDIFR